MIQGNQFEIFLGISWECGSSFHLTCFSGRISGIKCLDEVFHRSRAAVVIIYGNVVRRICNTNFTKQIPILSNEQTPDSGRLSTKNPCFSKEYPWTGWIYPVFTITCFTNFMWPLGVVPRCRPRLWRDIPDEMLGHVRDSKKNGWNWWVFAPTKNLLQLLLLEFFEAGLFDKIPWFGMNWCNRIGYYHDSEIGSITVWKYMSWWPWKTQDEG